MQNMYPPSRVLISKDIPITFHVSTEDAYIDVYSKEEREAIIAKYYKPNLFNGSCIRLDSVNGSVGYLSPVCFYDFFCCNIVGIHNKDQLALRKLNLHLAKYGKINTFKKLLGVKELPNIIGVSTLLHDINNEYLLVERNTSVSVGSGLFACTSSGSLDVSDMKYVNPIVGCAQRELREELNLQCDLYIEGIIAPVQKLQPVALLTGTVNRPWREIIPVMIQAEDFSKENNRLLIVPKDKLIPLISMYSFTDASAYQIFLEADGTAKQWKKAKGTFINLQELYYRR